MSVSPDDFGIQGFSFPFVVSPVVGDVRLGTNYGAGGTELTGTLDAGGGGGTVPSASDVRLGVAVAFGTGTLVVPAQSDVRLAVGYGAGGSEFTGTVALPGVSSVLLGVGYGAGGTEFTGTLAGGGGPTAAQIADKVLGRNVAGGSDGGRTVAQALATLRNKVAFDVPAAGQFTVYAADDVTPLWTGTYGRGSNTLGPLTGVDPS